MKKTKLLIFCISLTVLFSLCTFAAEKVTIPTFDVTLNDDKVISDYREYPLIVYNDITYLPMTYFDTRHLGLETTWDSNTRTLTIEKTDISGAYRGYETTAKNNKTDYAAICDFNIIVNGKQIDNTKEKYPLLTYRNVTYFPLTWRFAVDEFNWVYGFSAEEGLHIVSGNKKLEKLALPNLGGNMAVATDGRYYYYTGNANNIYRVISTDFSNPEIIHTMPENPDFDMTMVDFYEWNDSIYFTYHIGGAIMGSTFRYKIDSETGKCESTTDGTYASSGIGFNSYQIQGESATFNLLNEGSVGTSKLYTVNGEELAEIKVDGVVLGERKIGTKIWYNNPQLVGDKLFVTGYEKSSDKNSDLYVYDVNKEEISKLIENVGVFYAYSAWDDDIAKDTTCILYDKDGNRYRYSTVSGITKTVDEKVMPMKFATGNSTVYVVCDDGRTSSVMVYDSYASGLGSVKFEIYKANGAVEYYTMGDFLLANAPTGFDIRLSVFDMYHGYFRTSEHATNIFIHGNTLIFTCYDNKEPFVVETNLN